MKPKIISPNLFMHHPKGKRNWKKSHISSIKEEDGEKDEKIRKDKNSNKLSGNQRKNVTKLNM